ncbi:MULTISPECIES: NAD+ synthase [unclassified Haladaptatus]|uniref:NAD+ synthase n=1 Tax=unclassified Haladaptatus TaxID=2622732 RepID=UPI0023E800F6|nr:MULTISPECIES: NAD+ synthase [unclassified Haladaptatus]
MTDTQSADVATRIDLSFTEAELDAHREHITQFIRDQVRAAGVDGAVLGLSGGIDSTLTAFLAVEALGKKHVRGLVLPSEVNAADNMSDAERVAQLLEIEYDVIEINPIVEEFLAAVPEAADDQLAAGNVRVRTRAVLNYLVANHDSRLVLGTGNRSEALVGYFTKYGDGAVDCHPIANLYKGQVRQLARHVGVSEDLAAKTATAEMWVGQTDEEEMGVSYDTLDQVLALHVDGPLTKAQTMATLGVDESVVDRVDELYTKSEHKRHVPPGPDPLSGH